ncbi:ABC transporter ATP-binding protein [Kibdelosporangium phytohabitans]|uniref:ABC transporter ATP-binding protein n=1 Tax=Kibdelosporangium phytohabitans TaxID=860235 RepID=A0A0N9I9H6_9PSEU|nr:ABC transporter ATP-binding protein [Kibdelosporangium phytohabitans]ALG11296.1 ABC transporter ATP-binding protein [Kibdelosporangium phytohabitans]MBE1462591.1 iron complex transport system ATP-binding protein [Kibdelosporangium phytohabitans]
MDIALTGVSVDIAGKSLIRDLHLEADSGQVVGLVGPNGSGKSTALRCVYRALTPSAGAVYLDGTDVATLTLRENAQRVAALTQDNHTDLDFTVSEVVALGRTPHLRGNQPLSATEHALCREAMEQTDVLHLQDRSVLTLSGGERQRVFIARALVQQPKVLVLDEPTNHLDVRHQVELLSFLGKSGLTVLVAIHDLNLAAAACDRLGVLAGGEVVAAGAPVDVLTTDLVRRVFGVDATIVAHPRTGVPQLLYDLREKA